MWILPKQLHALSGAPDTEAFLLDLNEQSQACSQSLMVRSKHSPLRTWLAKWKRDSWTQHLFGRILKPSHAKAFEEKWTSLLRDTLVSHSPQQESGKEKTTQDTSGPTSEIQYELFSLDSVSLKTSKDTSRWDSPASSAIWKSWVTRCRGEYSARAKSVRLTSASGSSSWPTCQANDSKDTGPLGSKSCTNHIQRNSLLAATVKMYGPPAPANPSTHGSRPESQQDWRTPGASDGEGGVMEMREGCAGKYKLRDHVAAEQKKQWATPIMGDSHLASTPEVAQKRIEEGKVTLSRQMAAQWATPQAKDHKSGHRDSTIVQYKQPNVEVEAKATGKLNPRWVETLMGLPVGWTMPSCVSPATIAPTNSDSSATESCLPPQSEHSELF